MDASVTPGLIVLHGNQLEMLRSAVFQWLRQHPLGALEAETFLVQSNGVAEWLKIALAEELGICAATRVALPARFLWETYRGMLGHEQVPTISAFDKGPLTWRLMRLLPTLLEDPVFAPLRHFLADGAPERRLQLAERLADLYDQYQVYRADWLEDWAHGRDQLRLAGAAAPAQALAPDQCWQAQLWRAVIADVDPAQRELGRATIHTEFVRAAAAGEAPRGHLPRRIVIFGVSALPFQTLQALAALAGYTQVLLAVPNPCQFYWGDIIEGRELLRATHKRQQPRNGQDLGALPLEQLHAHSHPLLASWGRQGRDFIRLLDEFDSASASLHDGDGQPLRVDLFSAGAGNTLLEQIQAAVRDLLPLAEHPLTPPPASDCSLQFHIAHSVQREVEVLHDQLLAMLAADSSLRPRDVVVMVPDIDTFTAAIHAVFAQYRRSDARYIPFEIGDVNDRSVNPLLVALEWLLRLPQQRCRQSEVRDLLDVPAVARRYGLDSEDMATLGLWIEGVGVRWGLDPEHRSGLGLGAVGEQNSWLFGVRRMLLGYASGEGAAFGGIEPYGEVGGLDAALAGSLAQLVSALLHWRGVLAQQCTPAEWGVQARALLAAFFSADEEGDRLTLAQLDEALGRWLETCDNAGFVEAVPLAVLREAWLGLLDEPTLNHQFVSGGVTFCTLMPMRAVPFRVVCLLGMNDGDFPRRAPRADFDLLALPGMARPGDRSRRDDDRYLMLEAVLAARDQLYISWVGRNVRDNSAQPPSVLVAQLCDYLRAGWNIKLEQLTTEHALQPFSRRYFEQDGLLTYAREWRVAHGELQQADAVTALPAFELDTSYRLKLADLVNFMRQPARYFFRQRLGVVFGDAAQVGEDEEPFALDGLERYQLEDQLLADEGEDELAEQVADQLTLRAARLAREGRLPIGLIGQQYQQQLVAGLVPVRSAWLQLRQRYPYPAAKVAVALALPAATLEDWVDQLRSDGHSTVWLGQISSKVMGKQGEVRAEKLIEIWLRQLALAASGSPVTAHLIARDAHVQMAPMLKQAAQAALEQLAGLWRENMNQPLPTACKTALALLNQQDARAVYDGGYELSGEVADLCLARLWPEYAELERQAAYAEIAERLYGPLRAWLGEAVTIYPLDQEGAV